MSEPLPKLIRIVRIADGGQCAYVGDQPLWFVRYSEDYSRGGHTVTLTIPAEHIEFEQVRHDQGNRG